MLEPIRPTDVHSLTDFHRNAKKHVEWLAETGRPRVLTVNGRAAAVIPDPEAYHRVHSLALQLLEIQRMKEGLSPEAIQEEWSTLEEGYPDTLS